jgi:hypothetical protein
MKDQFVLYEIALKLKEKGFDEQCLAFYRNDNQKLLINNTFAERAYLEDRVPLTQTPIWQQVIDWLDKKEIFCSADIRIESGLFKWYPIIKTVQNYEHIPIELKPRGTKINALIDAIEHALTLI